MKRWLLMVILWGAGAVPSAASPILRWAPADTTLQPGQQATLSIMLDDTLTVRTIEIYLTYDSDIITSVHGGPGAMFDGFNLFSGFQEVDPENPGLWHGYCVILGAEDWAVGPGELFSWTVLGEAEGISGSVSDSVNLLPPGGGDYEAVVLPGIDIRVAFASAVPVHLADDAALHLYPNPFNPRVQVDFLPGGRGGRIAGGLRSARQAGGHLGAGGGPETGTGDLGWTGCAGTGPPQRGLHVLVDGAGWIPDHQAGHARPVAGGPIVVFAGQEPQHSGPVHFSMRERAKDS